MIIESLFEKKKPVISFEIFPPKKEAELNNIDETLKTLAKLHPDFISVTFGAGGSGTNNRTVDLAKKIKEEYDIEPLVLYLQPARFRLRKILQNFQYIFDILFPNLFFFHFCSHLSAFADVQIQSLKMFLAFSLLYILWDFFSRFPVFSKC